ncbi:MAG TPA: YIP1 family protein [Spirochaetota bacterium]|nr:YIP1 family protein [Spirochaetota bacterium]
MKKTLYYFFKSIVNPKKSFEELSDDNESLKYGWLIILFIGIVYGTTLFLNIVFAKLPWAPALVKIPDNYYYIWATFAGTPAIVCFYIMSSGMIHMLGKIFKAEANFEKTFALTSYAISLPMSISWILETAILIGLLITGKQKPEGIWITIAILSYVLTGVYTLILMPFAVFVSQKIKVWQSIAIGTFTSIVFLLFVVLMMA